MTNGDAATALEKFLALRFVNELDEPPRLRGLWLKLGALNRTAPKVWMDAYLAAFAITLDVKLVTLDSDFKTYVANGLNLRLLAP
jgi:predicted nucleic acid-binding protein